MGFIEEQQLESAYVMGTYARKPVELVRGRGMQVEDAEGRTYLDFVSGVGAVSLGHCHPALASAIEEQASTLVHVSNYYYIEHRGEVAHLVSDLLNECVDEGERTPRQSFFANSGAEANECAFKLARLHAKKRAMAAAEAAGADEDGVRAAAAAAPRLIVTLDASFHGRTLATLAATAQPAKKEAAPKKAPAAAQPAPAAPKAEVPAAAPVAAPPAGDDERAAQIREFLTGLLERMEVKAEPRILVTEEGNYKVELLGEGLGALIGRRGETLDAIQQLTSYAVNKGQSRRVRIHVDAENYRAKREESLQRLARKVAGKVVKYRRNVTLEPMNAYERHVIHTALQDYPDVTTYSTGAEPNRRTVVAYSRGEHRN